MTKLWAMAFLIFSSSAWAAGWSLQVTFPDYEVKNFKLEDSSYKPFLPKTSWRCYVGETQFIQKTTEVRSLKCNYSVKDTGEFTQLLSCGKDKKFSELVIDLKDEAKGLDFKVHLICRYSS